MNEYFIYSINPVTFTKNKEYAFGYLLELNDNTSDQDHIKKLNHIFKINFKNMVCNLLKIEYDCISLKFISISFKFNNEVDEILWLLQQ
jgi:hypothetical protein